jgi:hypothetical protein
MHSLLSAVYRSLKEIWKIKEINGSQVSKRAPNENRPEHGEIQEPKCAQYLTHLPASCTQASLQIFHHSASSVIAVRTSCTLSQCLCSECNKNGEVREYPQKAKIFFNR